MARTTRISAIFSILMVLGLVGTMASPASAHHKTDHAQGGGNSASDHDGDADSDPGTATEDSHTPEPDATPSDNQHPSGKDRSGESGGSGNQGKAESNPDDSKGPMRYEGGLGDDKPNGPGGTDRDDQDGNNGCGNDDDFDDDNNGHCGRPEREDEEDEVAPVTIELCPAGSDMAGARVDEVESCNVDEPKVQVDEVLPQAETKDSVLPQVVTAAATEGAVLPFTGGEVTYFLAAALGLITSGTLALVIRRRSTN